VNALPAQVPPTHTMRLLDRQTGLLECRFCGARYSAEQRDGRIITESWICRDGCGGSGDGQRKRKRKS